MRDNMISYLKSLLNYAPRLCERVGITATSSFLGNGVHGAVFSVNGNIAVKLTHSAVEARVSRALIGRRLKNVVQVYSVHRVGRKRQWLICMERLRKHRLGFMSVLHPDVYAAKRSLARLGFKHRDMHERNIMVCPTTKRLKVIDFGCTIEIGK